MVINLYKVKKWSAGFLMAFMPTLTFLIMVIVGDFIQALIAFFVMIPFSMFIAFKLMGHPLLEFLEGKGMLVFTLDSTGTIEAFIVKVLNPYIVGQHRGKRVETIFDRESVVYMSFPQKVTARIRSVLPGGKSPHDASFEIPPGTTHQGDPNANQDPNYEELIMKVPKENKNSILHGFTHFPVLIYNKNLETFLSKDMLTKLEKETFVDHMVLYLNRKIEDLTSQLRDFARYIVDQTRPKKSIFSNPIFKLMLILIVIIILGALLAPYILGGMESFAGGLMKDTSIINPK